MKKIILMLLLAAMSTGAMAEWVKSHSDDEYDNYLDLATIRKNGDAVKMWDMKDYRSLKVVSKIKYKSAKTLREYDCAKATFRTLSMVLYQEPMGKGDVMFASDGSASWSHVVPDTISDIQWQVACEMAKRKQPN